MSLSSRSENKKCSSEKQEPSKVLLVCIYDTIALDITNQSVYERFCKFGPILRILIFEKGEVTKLFVEFGETEHASNAKNTLDGTKLLGAICKMNIYFSNFSNVDLKNETSQGADFRMQEEMKNQYFRRFDNLSKSYQSDNNDFLEDELIMEAAFSPFPSRSKTDNPKRIQDEINLLQKREQSRCMINEEDEIDDIISNGIFNILQSKSTSSDRKLRSTQGSLQHILPTMKIKENSQSKNPILSFQIDKEISNKHIYNLFSNFGNIAFINKKKKRAFVKFRTLQFSAIAFTYLNNFVLMGNDLKLESPEFAEEAEPKEGQFCECTYYDQSFDRFTANRSITVNSPSQTLHVSSLKKQVCKQSTLWKIFSDYGKVEAVKILCHSNEKNMALVKFYSIEDSFEAIAELHNSSFSGRRIQISFTKSRV